MNIYNIKGKTFGPKPTKTWKRPYEREFDHVMVARDITDGIAQVEKHELARPFAEDVSTSHSDYTYHDPAEVRVVSVVLVTTLTLKAD